MDVHWFSAAISLGGHRENDVLVSDQRACVQFGDSVQKAGIQAEVVIKMAE